MKVKNNIKIFIAVITFALLTYNCSSQNNTRSVVDISNTFDLNYTLSNIQSDGIKEEILFNGGMVVKVFKIWDSKATPENYFNGSDEVLESLLISVTPDGDYYTSSKLFKIEGLLNVTVLNIQEKKYPNFVLEVELGKLGNRMKDVFEISGTFD